MSHDMCTQGIGMLKRHQSTMNYSRLFKCNNYYNTVASTPVVLKLFGLWATFVFQKPFAGHKEN